MCGLGGVPTKKCGKGNWQLQRNLPVLFDPAVLHSAFQIILSHILGKAAASTCVLPAWIRACCFACFVACSLTGA